MPLVSEERSSVRVISQFIAIMTLNVNWPTAEKAILDKRSHTARGVTKLLIVPNRDLQVFLIRQIDEALGFFLAQREWLLYVDMAAHIQAQLRNITMAGRRCCDMNDIRFGLREEFAHILKTCLNRKPFVELPRHQRFPVADSDNLAFRDPLNLRGMRICDFPAPYNGDLKHLFARFGKPRNSALIPLP